jgi:dihydrodipicolinate synthase/N-acetylneuraminate lyase
MPADPVLSSGLIAAALTPFVADTVRVDRARFVDQLETIAGYAPTVTGVSVAAVESQEFQVLDRAARLALVELTVQTLPDRLPVVGGVSAASPRESIALATELAELGATAALAVATPKPWGAPPTPDEAHRWFGTLADASPIPVLLYNNPRLGVDLSVATMARICAHPNVVAIKETSRDETKLLGLINQVQGSAQVFTNMELLLSTLVLGGAGAMLPTSGLPVAERVVRHVRAGEHRRAAELALFFAEFPSRWTQLGFLPAVKAATGLLGRELGGPVWPWSDLDEPARAELREFLAKWDLLDEFTRKENAR